MTSTNVTLGSPDPGDFSDGAPFPEIARSIGDRGYQAVPCNWNAITKATTPMRGFTGGTDKAPFRTGAVVAAMTQGIVVHRLGGSDCGRGAAKVAVRPPLDITLLDIDDGYAGKTGADTLNEAEMMLGPLPRTWSLTARGQWTPSRRRWIAHPTDLVLKDRFFRDFGGCIETIRTGHRFTWAPPSVHQRKGQIVGPVLNYDPDMNVCIMPSADQIREVSQLPQAWLDHGYKLMEIDRERPLVSAVADAQGRRPITVSHANATVDKALKTLHSLAPQGGGFRSAVFGLAAVTARRGLALGASEADIHAEMAEMFAAHPRRLAVDTNDARWIDEGIASAKASGWALLPDADDLESTEDITYPVMAQDEELDTLLDVVDQFRDPSSLGRLVGHMKADVGQPGALVRHAYKGICEAADDKYPARRVLAAVDDVYRTAGGRNPLAPRKIMLVALGAILDEKAAR